MTAPLLFDRDLLLARRERALRSGEFPDFLLRHAGQELAERLAAVQRRFTPVLTVSAVPGLLGRLLRPAAGPGPYVELEASHAGMPLCGGLALRADEEKLPIRDGSAGLIVSALTLQLANDLPGALVQIRRALKPDGLFLGALLGGNTLRELRETLISAEMECEGGASPRVAPMGDIRDYGALLQRAGFALPVADADVLTVTYPTPLDLMRDLRRMGAANALAARRKSLMRRGTLARALEAYAQRFPARDGRVVATFEIVYLAGWAPHDSQQKPLRPGSAKARLAEALGTEEHRLKR